MTQRQVENLLQTTLVPVEPNPQFLQRLRATLVTFRQNGPSGWVLVAAAGSILLLISATFAVSLRLLLIAVGLVSVATAKRGRRT